MQEILKQIENKNSDYGFKISGPASLDKIKELESNTGFKLPEDFIRFYTICDGFECHTDIFNFLSIDTILANKDYGNNWFLFAEYMIYSDFWGLRKNITGDFEFFNSAHSIPSHALIDFLKAFSQGNIFEKDGISDWEKIG
ncbi:SMI1/KNR4 family protein SUKH-1 [Chryseobacterium sp. 52]|uniref:SMI1/KNR4 family protein n=1 Tax=Chryseobacterium sp. 52 TaxID=2035213 RepID=UPI000C19A9AA|nr:SMI1/KNR4 family protein [Chryseobacterium sp. 52]PIF47496.1 SMI1/KNR4 family protein SUKH-1 [Chryseobacterium sp. 52]